MRDIISKVRHVTAEAVRVLNRLLRDNPFTYLSVQCIVFVHNPFTYLSDTDGQEVGERFT